MISMTVVPVPLELGMGGRCWMCRQHFADDEFYCQLSLPCGDQVTVWATCLGCSCQLACKSTNEGGKP